MRALITILAFATLLILAPVGADATGVSIYFDAAHDADSSTVAFLTEFVAAVEGAGHKITQFNTEITGAALQPYDVLMVHDPETALSSVEISAIQGWLALKCRGLWVIGSQPGAFHMASTNDLLTPYSIQFSGMAGASIPDVATPVGSHPTMNGVSALTLNNHGELTVGAPALCIADDSQMDCVGAAVDFVAMGMGRVAVWGDASTFKNMEFGQNDEAVWVVNTIEWLAEGCPPVSVEEGTWGGVKALYR